MVSSNVTVDDNSPLITYWPLDAWDDTGGQQALDEQPCFQSSSHATATPGASASFAFTGTGVWLFGGQDPSSATYTITLDGNTLVESNDHSELPCTLVPLGGISGLDMGEHTVALVNKGSGSVALDYLVFETQNEPPIGLASSLTRVTTEASLPAMSYHSFSTHGFQIFATNPTAFNVLVGRADNDKSANNANPVAAEALKKWKQRQGVIGGVIAVVVLLLIGLIGFLIWLRRRYRRAREELEKTPAAPVTPSLPIQPVPKSPGDAEKGPAPLPTWYTTGPELQRSSSIASSMSGSSLAESVSSMGSMAPLVGHKRNASMEDIPRPPSAAMTKGRHPPSRSSTLDQMGGMARRTSQTSRSSVSSLKGRPLIMIPNPRESYDSDGDSYASIISKSHQRSLSQNSKAPARPIRPPTLTLSPINELPQFAFDNDGRMGIPASPGRDAPGVAGGLGVANGFSLAPPGASQGPKTPYSPGIYDLYEAR